MRCETMRRRLSDDLDGALSPRKKVRLEAHLRHCPGCRAYRDDIVRFQAGAATAADRSPDYWAAFERRLEARLDSVEPGRKVAGVPFFTGRRWAVAAVGFLLLAAAGTYLGVRRPGGPLETAWINYEDSLAPLLQEAEASPEFGNLVNREILGSIEDMAPVIERDFAPSFADDPLFWEGLSDQELEFIAAELAKETGQGGPK
jgi:Putative zinc-finger